METVLEPSTSAEIVRAMHAEFNEAYRLGFFLALARTFSIPSISEVLLASGGFENPQERLFMTGYGITLLYEKGYAGPEGDAVLSKIRRAHNRPDITNDKLLYVLSAFVSEPLQMIEKFRRKPTELEHLATHVFWTEIGKRIGIKEIPDAEGLKEYQKAYEAQHQKYSPANAKLANRILEVVSLGDQKRRSELIGLLPTKVRVALEYNSLDTCTQD